MGLQSRNPFDSDAFDDLDAEDPDELPIDDVDTEPIRLGALHHVGFVVADLDDALADYRDLFGATVIDRADLPDEAVSAALVDMGGSRLMLLAPLDDESWIIEFLDGQPSSLNHAGYEVDDLDDALVRLRDAGWELIDEEPRSGLDGLRTTYVHPPDQPGTLLLLVEQT